MNEPQVRLSDDDRYELSQRAAASTRASKPTAPLVVGALALLVGVAALLWASMKRADAIDRLESQRRRLEQVASIEQRLAAIETRRRQGATGVHAPLTDLLSRLERAAADAGITRLNFPTENSSDQQGVIDHRLTYTIRNESLEDVLEWINIATQRIPGLEVYDVRLVISPAGRGSDTSNSWIVTVTLARWERPQ